MSGDWTQAASLRGSEGSLGHVTNTQVKAEKRINSAVEGFEYIVQYV